jgi:hypothetical protein
MLYRYLLELGDSNLQLGALFRCFGLRNVDLLFPKLFDSLLLSGPVTFGVKQLLLAKSFILYFVTFSS